MLGVRRAGVTVALGMLRRAGCIGNGRASVQVVDRTALEGASCRCYALNRRRLERLERLHTLRPADAWRAD
jgi:hypothetical protein